MKWFKVGSEPTTTAASFPIPSERVEEIAEGFTHRKEWVCGCGARLKIRSKDPHADGPSNFFAYASTHPQAGHSKLPAGDLTWNGMAAERGWKTDPVECPACQRGLTVAVYKQRRRDGYL